MTEPTSRAAFTAGDAARADSSAADAARAPSDAAFTAGDGTRASSSAADAAGAAGDAARATSEPGDAARADSAPFAESASGGTAASGAASGTTPSPGVKTVAGPDRHAPAALDDHHHADVSGGWLRPAVFGAMDGLVTNIALISGVGGGGASRHTIVLTGIAGLVAGAISMGLGEYTSVRTQNDQVAREVAKERRELERHPEAEAEELALRWIGRGLPPELARQVAQAVAENPEEALRVHAQEELGVDPHEVPSPWTAAVSSFICFALGAVIPLLPYLVGFNNLWPALIVGGFGLFFAGALTSRFTNQRWWHSGLRQLLLGAAAAAATYGIGHLIGVGAVG
jgi:VIT1/CCC1 family predicted Fe2+/Mn2+ transporter